MDEARQRSAEVPDSPARLHPERGQPALADSPEGGAGGGLPDKNQLATDRGDEFDSDETGEPADELERLRRRGEDQQILTNLAACDFAGPFFEAYQAELIAYAVPVMTSWIQRGLIFYFCTKRGRSVTAADAVREHLANDSDARAELVNESIAHALKDFFKRVLIDGEWTIDGGASVKTYFIGACINAFPNVFRRWLGEHDQRHGVVYGLHATGELSNSTPLYQAIDVDPAEVVASLHAVCDELARLDPDLREVGARIAFLGETHAEANEALGLSERATEGRFYRERRKRRARDQNRKGGNDARTRRAGQ